MEEGFADEAYRVCQKALEILAKANPYCPPHGQAWKCLQHEDVENSEERCQRCLIDWALAEAKKEKLEPQINGDSLEGLAQAVDAGQLGPARKKSDGKADV